MLLITMCTPNMFKSLLKTTRDFYTEYLNVLIIRVVHVLTLRWTLIILINQMNSNLAL